MTRYKSTPVIISAGKPVETPVMIKNAREKTLAYRILRAHHMSAESDFAIHFDALISHDITYVSIIQTARASGMESFPIPYAMTNCHNSLCAVGGTINEDDHAFGLSAAKKYGGIYVPANLAVIHQYAREKLSCCGGMVLGSDSHTRYGCYGAMGVGEGGGELVKQLLENTWDIDPPEVVLVWLEGTPKKGIGPHDVAISLVGETFPDGLVKNKILEFAGPGARGLSMDFRAGIDVMTTETGCLSSIWETDETVKAFYEDVGRPEAYQELCIEDGACYDAVITIDLDKMESMIALPFHPSRAVTIHELQKNPEKYFKEVQKEAEILFGDKIDANIMDCIVNGKVTADQGVIVGCAGGMYESISEAASILHSNSTGNGYFDLSVYPSSAPVSLAITKDGTSAKLMEAGVVIKPSFCGPCFGAGETPATGSFSIRHATRNFPNREGSKPGSGQLSFVALMDARSIAATAMYGGVLMAATDVDYEIPEFQYKYDDTIYEKRVYEGFSVPRNDYNLKLGPNIKDWPVIPAMEDNMLLRMCSVIHDEVTTTDELIPSGETSSYRSNPLGLAEFTLSRRDPEYVERSKAVRGMDWERRRRRIPEDAEEALMLVGGELKDTVIGSCIFAKKPGDGSAREQAASCQKVLGGLSNICYEYATKRYRSNCINWGIVPFTIEEEFKLKLGDWVYVPDLRQGLLEGKERFAAKTISGGKVEDIILICEGLSQDEKEILTDGCLMNYYAKARRREHE